LGSHDQKVAHAFAGGISDAVVVEAARGRR
jgi:hypothetical protein